MINAQKNGWEAGEWTNRNSGTNWIREIDSKILSYFKAFEFIKQKTTYNHLWWSSSLLKDSFMVLVIHALWTSKTVRKLSNNRFCSWSYTAIHVLTDKICINDLSLSFLSFTIFFILLEFDHDHHHHLWSEYAHNTLHTNSPQCQWALIIIWLQYVRSYF